MFDPETDGPSAIRGGCSRCQDLQTILENHQRTLQLMRSFAPIQVPRKKAMDPDAERQQNLFEAFADAAAPSSYS
jgi:hypothetical protein